MEAVLWYVLTSPRGSNNRVRILRAIDEQPLNANKLAERLKLHYTTIRHHLDVLVDTDIVQEGGQGYGSVYLPSDRCRDNWDIVEKIVVEVDSLSQSDSPRRSGREIASASSGR